MLELFKKANGYEVRVANGARIPLPTAAELRGAAIAAAEAFAGSDSAAVRILFDSEFDFEIVPGKDAVEQLIGVVITTAPEHAALLREPNQPILADVMGALLEACPEIGSERIVARGEGPPAPRRPKRIPAPKRADLSPDQDQWVRQLIRGFVNQGRQATAFGEAARWGHLALVQEMLSAGMATDVRTESGATALMLAASGGHIDVVRALIASGADVNAVNDTNGMTPLISNLAALHNEKTYLAVVGELVAAGADSSIADHDGNTPLDWARQRDSQRLIALLQESGKR